MKKLPITGIVSILVTLATNSSAQVAEFACPVPVEEGIWVNVSVDRADMALLEISHRNKCVPHGDTWEPYSAGPTWYVEATGECGVTDCNWGRVGAEQLYDPRWLDPQRQISRRLFPIFAAFDRGEYRRYLNIHMSKEERDVLQVHIYTDYLDGGPPDKAESMSFRRSGPRPSHGEVLTVTE